MTTQNYSDLTDNELNTLVAERIFGYNIVDSAWPCICITTDDEPIYEPILVWNVYLPKPLVRLCASCFPVYAMDFSNGRPGWPPALINEGTTKIVNLAIVPDFVNNIVTREILIDKCVKSGWYFEIKYKCEGGEVLVCGRDKNCIGDYMFSDYCCKILGRALAIAILLVWDAEKKAGYR